MIVTLLVHIRMVDAKPVCQPELLHLEGILKKIVQWSYYPPVDVEDISKGICGRCYRESLVSLKII